MTYEELEEQRMATQQRLMELEEQYIRKRENTNTGPTIREKMGFQNENMISPRERP